MFVNISRRCVGSYAKSKYLASEHVLQLNQSSLVAEERSLSVCCRTIYWEREREKGYVDGNSTVLGKWYQIGWCLGCLQQMTWGPKKRCHAKRPPFLLFIYWALRLYFSMLEFRKVNRALKYSFGQSKTFQSLQKVSLTGHRFSKYKT